MLEFRRPDPQMHREFVEVLDEFAVAGEHPHGSGVVPDGEPAERVKGPLWRAADLRAADAFAEFCRDMRNRADPTYAAGLGLVPDDKLWVVEDHRLLGFVSVRRRLDDRLRQHGGHIGYGVRPSARRRGVATAACAHGLQLLRAAGVDRALITCEEGNVASAATAERNGGVLDEVRSGMRYYWVELLGRPQRMM